MLPLLAALAHAAPAAHAVHLARPIALGAAHGRGARRDARRGPRAPPRPRQSRRHPCTMHMRMHVHTHTHTHTHDAHDVRMHACTHARAHMYTRSTRTACPPHAACQATWCCGARTSRTPPHRRPSRAPPSVPSRTRALLPAPRAAHGCNPVHPGWLQPSLCIPAAALCVQAAATYPRCMLPAVLTPAHVAVRKTEAYRQVRVWVRVRVRLGLGLALTVTLT